MGFFFFFNWGRELLEINGFTIVLFRLIVFGTQFSR